MKLSLPQENLAKALSVVGRVVSNRSSLPVLSNVLLSTEASRLKLAATNLEIGINYWLGAKIEKSGSITVPARLFSDFISSLPGGNLDLSVDDLSLTASSPHFESHINGISAEEFPLIPEIKSEPVISLPADEFKDALSQVVVAASLDEARPVLAGVYLYIEKGNLVIVATDSYRLAEKKLKLKKTKTEPDLAIIVPARTMQELTRVLADAEADLNVYLSENQVMFEVDGIELTSRLIDGQFPNYRQIIPDQTETEVEINTSEFARITKVASLFARESAGSVRVELKPEGQLHLISSASEIGDNTSTAECEVSGEGGEVSLNSRYLSEALALIKSEKVMFSTSGKLNPCVIKPTKDDDYIHIIMPLRT